MVRLLCVLILRFDLFNNSAFGTDAVLSLAPAALGLGFGLRFGLGFRVCFKVWVRVYGLVEGLG